jgi:hypothetical protein
MVQAGPGENQVAGAFYFKPIFHRFVKSPSSAPLSNALALLGK